MKCIQENAFPVVRRRRPRNIKRGIKKLPRLFRRRLKNAGNYLEDQSSSSLPRKCFLQRIEMLFFLFGPHKKIVFISGRTTTAKGVESKDCCRDFRRSYIYAGRGRPRNEIGFSKAVFRRKTNVRWKIRPRGDFPLSFFYLFSLSFLLAKWTASYFSSLVRSLSLVDDKEALEEEIGNRDRKRRST